MLSETSIKELARFRALTDSELRVFPRFQSDNQRTVILSETPHQGRDAATIENEAGAAPERPNGNAASIAATIAIDGPVASGKSAVGSRLARHLGYRLVDTGMMYRAITCLALDEGIDLGDEATLAALGAAAKIDVQPGPAGDPEGARVLVNGNDVTARLRSPEVGEAVSLVSRVPGVRRAMVAIQREIANQGRVVMVGRDIGTVVLPDAPLKAYLDASAGERARRRHAEVQAAGRTETLDEVRTELAMRDKIDRQRDASPLRPAEDALVINTDKMTIQQVVDAILEAMSCS